MEILFDLTKVFIGAIIGSTLTHSFHLRRDYKGRKNEAAKKLISEFQPLLIKIQAYDISPYDVLSPGYEKQQEAVNNFRSYLNKKQKNQIDILWKQYQGVDNSESTFILEHFHGGTSPSERRAARTKAVKIIKDILTIAGLINQSNIETLL